MATQIPRLPLLAFSTIDEDLTMDHVRIVRELEALETLGQALRWALAQSPRAEFVNEVSQDESTRDVIVRVAADLYAAFDVRCLGVVKAVSVWDHEPSADELLARRLERGWTPTPTATRDGDVVLGFAAKVADRNRRRGATPRSRRPWRLAGSAT